MSEVYASNLGKQTDMTEEKLIGIKSHDFPVFVETLIIPTLLVIYPKEYGNQS